MLVDPVTGEFAAPRSCHAGIATVTGADARAAVAARAADGGAVGRGSAVLGEDAGCAAVAAGGAVEGVPPAPPVPVLLTWCRRWAHHRRRRLPAGSPAPPMLPVPVPVPPAPPKPLLPVTLAPWPNPLAATTAPVPPAPPLAAVDAGAADATGGGRRAGNGGSRRGAARRWAVAVGDDFTLAADAAVATVDARAAGAAGGRAGCRGADTTAPGAA